MIEKGGIGSGIKGHRTEKKDKVEFLNRLKDFFKTKENYKIFKGQGGIKVLEDMHNFYGNKFTDLIKEGEIVYDSDTLPTSFIGGSYTMALGDPILYFRNETLSNYFWKTGSPTKRDHSKIINHELGHSIFGTFNNTIKTYRGGNPPNEGLVEGLAVLHSNIFKIHKGECEEYQDFTARTFRVLQKYAEKSNSTVPEIFLSLGINTEKTKRKENIAKFIKFANRSFSSGKETTHENYVHSIKDFHKLMQGTKPKKEGESDA